MKARSAILFIAAFIGMIAVGLSAPAPETGIALPGSGETTLSWLDRLISPLPLVGPLTKVLGISQPPKQQPKQQPKQAPQKPQQKPKRPAAPKKPAARPPVGPQRPQQRPQQRLPQQQLPQQRLPQQGLPQQRLPQQGLPQQRMPQQGLPQQRPGGIPNRTPAGLGGFGGMPGFA
ncbi:hypothetical protein GGH96_001299 [Coemansia sp. RSA 1972]|nr:hypothetical protein GGH96_001299 [Coemansia sp. RSA 1972]